MSFGVFRTWFRRPPASHPPALAVFAQGEFVAVSPASLTLTGQAISAAVSAGVSPSALTLTSQNVDAIGPLAAGALSLTGQAITARFDTSVLPTSALLQLAGQDIVAAISGAVSSIGSMTLTGQAITFRFEQTFDPGSLTLSGAEIVPQKTEFFVPTPNAIYLTGMTVGVNFSDDQLDRPGLFLPNVLAKPTYWRGMRPRVLRLS